MAMTAKPTNALRSKQLKRPITSKLRTHLQPSMTYRNHKEKAISAGTPTPAHELARTYSKNKCGYYVHRIRKSRPELILTRSLVAKFMILPMRLLESELAAVSGVTFPEGLASDLTRRCKAWSKMSVVKTASMRTSERVYTQFQRAPILSLRF